MANREDVEGYRRQHLREIAALGDKAYKHLPPVPRSDVFGPILAAIQSRPQSGTLIRADGTQNQIDADDEWERTLAEKYDYEFRGYPRAPGV